MKLPSFRGISLPWIAALLAGFAAICLDVPEIRSADRIKLNNTTALNNGGSWSGGVPSFSHMAVWNNTVTGANTSLLGGNVFWQGIRIADPGGAITIGPGNTLTLNAGQAGISIDMSAATQDLTIQSGLTLNSAVGQYWNVASGRTLTLETGLFSRGTGSTLNVQGPGTVNTTNIVNDTFGLVGTWATVGTGTSTRYATIDGSNNLIAYTGGTAAATAAGVTDTSGLLNYDVAAAGTLGADTSFNTLRYTGGTGTITGDFTANGILTAGSGTLTLSGNSTIGASGELVLMNGDSSSSRDITISGIIRDGLAGTSGITKGGLGQLTLSGANTYTGLTSISRGKVTLTNTGSLGSASGGTRIGLSGRLTLAGGVTTAEPIFLDDVTNAFSGGTLLENSGTNTLTGAIRLSSGTRWQSGGTLNVTGGISTTNGSSGSSMVMQAGTTMNITGKPISNGSGNLYMDNANRTIVLGVVGSTYGSNSLFAGTLQTDVTNALSNAATISFGVQYSSNPATLNLNGNDQTAGGINTNIYSVHSAYDRVITSATDATLSVGNNNANTTFDGRLEGAVSVTKIGNGTLTLTGPSTTTGNFAVNSGTLHLNFGRATESLSGAGAVSDYLPAGAPLTLDGGTFQLTGRSNGTATALTPGSWTSGNSALVTVSSTAGLAPGQLLTGTNLPAGAYVVSILNSTQFVVNTALAAAPTGTITATPNSFTTSQTFDGLTLNAGASAVTVTIPSSGSDGIVLQLGAITPNSGATVQFTLPSGTQSSTNGITTDTVNNGSGILGGWARVGNNWATNNTNTAGGNIVALSSYTDVNRLGGILTSNATGHIRIVEGGASGSITPAASGTTEINTLLQSATGGTATYDPGTTDVLRLGEAGGIMIASNAGALTLGAAANDGILTAGGAADTAGTIYLTNNHATNLLTVNSTIADNGSGIVEVTTSGPGTVVLTGTNTFTGRSIAGGGTIRISSEENLGDNPLNFAGDQLTLAGGTLNTTASFSINDSNRGITLAPAGGTISVNTSTTLTVANVITGTGKLVQSGTGTLALTAANTFTGSTLANAGTLALGNVNALQNSTLTTATTGNVTFTVPGTNTYNLGGLAGNDTVALGANTIRVGANHETTIFTGTLNGTGGLTKVGNGTLNLTNASTHSGDTRIEGGMIVLAHANALQNSTLDTGPAGTQSANLTLAEGSTYNIGGLKGSANFDLAVSHLSVGSNNQSTSFSGVLQGAFNNNVTKVGSGTLTLSGNNTYIGRTTVSAGQLHIGGTNLSHITVNAGANLGGEGSTAGKVVFLGSTHSLDIDAATMAALGSTDSGSLDLSALSAGGFTINITGTPINADPVKVLTYGSGGFLGSIDRFLLGSHAASASARGAGGFADNGIDAITIDLGYVTNTWVGNSGNPTFWDIGTTANWSNAKDSVFQNGDDVIFTDGALNLNPTLQSNVITDRVTFSNTTGTDYILSSAAAETLSTTAGVALTGSGDVTIESEITGSGSLTQSGTGTTTLTATNTFSGSTTITDGTLRLNSEANLGSNPAAFAADQLILDGVNATLTATSSFTIDDTNRGITLGTNGGSFGADAATTLTMANIITGSGSLNKVGSGSVSLSGANTYTGLTTVNAGILELNNSGGGNAIAGDSVAGTPDIQVNTGGTLKLATADQIADDATVDLNGGIWNLNGQNETIRNLTARVATTAPGLTLGTGSILTLNRVDWDNIGGSTTSNLTGGTLRFVADDATQPVFDTNYVGTLVVSSAVQIDATSLTFNASTYGTTLNGKISGTGKVIHGLTGQAGGLTLTNSTNDYSGGTQWKGGSGAWTLFTVTASGALGSGDVTIQGGNQSTWTAAFSGTPSAFTFAGGNTAHANNFVLEGNATVSISSPVGTTAAADSVTLSGTVDLGGNTLYVRGRGTGTITGVISGTGGITRIDDPGTWIFSGTNTYTGDTNVSAGTLIINGDQSAATGTVTVATGATLGGNGIIGGGTTIDGTLSTGAAATVGSVGTLDFNGNDLAFNNGSTWLVDLVQGASESSDSILVNNLTIDSTSTLTFNVSSSFNGDEYYTLATYSSLSGAFSNFATSGIYDIGGNSYHLEYGATALTLTAVPEPGTLGLLFLGVSGFFYRRLQRRLRH